MAELSRIESEEEVATTLNGDGEGGDYVVMLGDWMTLEFKRYSKLVRCELRADGTYMYPSLCV